MKLTRIVAVVCALAAVFLVWNASPNVPMLAALRGHPVGGDGDGESRKPSHVVLPRVSLPILLNAHGEADSLFTLPRSRSRNTTLVIALSYADCYGKLADVPFWSEIQERYGSNLHVTGVVSGGTVEMLQYFLTQQGVQIPVSYDSEGVVRDAILQGGYLTPAMVLLDSVGTVVHVEESRAGNAQLQVEYLMKLDQLVEFPHARPW